jgi:hypothetical protein
MNLFKGLKLLFATLIVLAIWACDDSDNPTPDQNEVQGKWKLESISGGFTGSGYKADWNQLELKSDLSYRRLKNDTLRFQGTYAIQQKDGKTYLNFKASANSIFEDHDKEVVLEKEKFILRDPCCDLFEYTFAKQRN